MNKLEILIDGQYGSYVPTAFTRQYCMDDWHIEARAKAYCEADNEMKSWIWDDILNEAYFVDTDGYKWTLHHEDDLYAIREDYEWED